MYCRNCGNEMNEGAVVCVKCGVPTGKGNTYCPNCGAEVHPESVMCVTCGATLAAPEPEYSEKSKLTAGLLGIFLGAFGVHNFYLGYIAKAVIQLVLSTVVAAFTCGLGALGASIWGLIEGIFILCDNINKDGKGKLLRK